MSSVTCRRWYLLQDWNWRILKSQEEKQVNRIREVFSTRESKQIPVVLIYFGVLLSSPFPKQSNSTSIKSWVTVKTIGKPSSGRPKDGRGRLIVVELYLQYFSDNIFMTLITDRLFEVRLYLKQRITFKQDPRWLIVVAKRIAAVWTHFFNYHQKTMFLEFQLSYKQSQTRIASDNAITNRITTFTLPNVLVEPVQSMRVHLFHLETQRKEKTATNH